MIIEEYLTFVAEWIAPVADRFDREECFSAETIQQIAQAGYLGALIPEQWGGVGLTMSEFGHLNEAFGRACSSARSLITVHSMVSSALMRWGSSAQRDEWLPQLARGETIGAFALSEPNIGSDASQIETTAVLNDDDDTFILNGTKKWTTFGQIADLYLTFAKCNGQAIALLVGRDTPGLTITPLQGMIGTRGSMIAELHFDDCLIPRANQIGGMGFGIAAVALSALDVGRYSVAWGCVGIGQACLDATLAYTSQRQQFGEPLKSFQLVQRMVSNMVTNVKAARLLCLDAGRLHDEKSRSATAETLTAKYFASQMAYQVATDAVQLHGANGCSSDYPVQRYLRDAKVMEIIEGSHQMQQQLIAQNAYQQKLTS